jgi:hypothetical protein
MAFASCHGLVGNNACMAEPEKQPRKARQSKEMSLVNPEQGWEPPPPLQSLIEARRMQCEGPGPDMK